MHKPMLKMSQTEDYVALNSLYLENDLEIDPDHLEKTEANVKSWKITHGAEAYLAAGITLSTRDGEYIIEGIAVQPLYRKMGLASVLLDKAVEEAKYLGAKNLLLIPISFFQRSI